MLAVILSHYKTDGDWQIGRHENDSDGMQPLDIALTWAQFNSRACHFLCWHAVCMLLEALCELETMHGSLNVLLRNVTDTKLCLQLCERLVAEGANVNQHSNPTNTTDDNMDEQIPEDIPLVASTARAGEDSLVLTHLLLDAGANPNICVHVTGLKVSCLLYSDAAVSVGTLLLCEFVEILFEFNWTDAKRVGEMPFIVVSPAHFAGALPF
jgi:hypothetical protein